MTESAKTARRRIHAFLTLFRYARMGEQPRLLVVLLRHCRALLTRKTESRRQTVRLNGYHLSFAPGQMSGLTFFVEVIIGNLYGRLDSGAVSRLDRPVILDAGANVGCFTLWAARRWPRAVIVAVEPQPQAYQDLLANIAANQLQERVIPLANALSQVSGRQVMNIYKLHNMATLESYAGVDPRELDTTTTVDCLSIDEIEAAHGLRFDLIKMDIEGGEGSAFRGGAGALSHVAQVVVETHSSSLRHECEAMLTQGGLVVGEQDGLLFACREPEAAAGREQAGPREHSV